MTIGIGVQTEREQAGAKSQGGYEIREFGSADSAPAPASALAKLHAELLDHSPVVLLGPEFMEEFYYSVLPANELIFGALACVDEQPAGFIVATADAEGFMSQAIRRHAARLAWICAKSVVRSPRRILAMKEAVDIQRNVKSSGYGPEVGELLSFGVRKDYRSRAFVERTGARIGADLLQVALRQQRDRGKTTLRAIVDKDNLEAQFFYRAQGWRVGQKSVEGWRVPTMEFLIDLD